MAPTNEHAVATVFSTQVKSSEDGSILVEAGGFTPTRWFLEHAAHGVNDHAEAPRKKRRKARASVEMEGDENSDVVVETAAEETIPIHRVSIDLQFPDTLQSRPAKRKAIEDDVEYVDADEVAVVPFGIDSDDDGFRLQLSAPKNLGAVLVIECSNIAQSVCDALRRIALPGQLRASYAGQREKTNPATILRCTLKRSKGQSHNVIRLEGTVSWRSGVSAFPQGMPVGKARVYEDYELLVQAYQDVAREDFDHTQPWSPSDFYDSVHVPHKSTDKAGILEGVLDTELYPFQERAVSWMLRRNEMIVAK